MALQFPAPVNRKPGVPIVHLNRRQLRVHRTIESSRVQTNLSKAGHDPLLCTCPTPRLAQGLWQCPQADSQPAAVNSKSKVLYMPEKAHVNFNLKIIFRTDIVCPGIRWQAFRVSQQPQCTCCLGVDEVVHIALNDEFRVRRQRHFIVSGSGGGVWGGRHAGSSRR